MFQEEELCLLFVKHKPIVDYFIIIKEGIFYLNVKALGQEEICTSKAWLTNACSISTWEAKAEGQQILDLPGLHNNKNKIKLNFQKEVNLCNEKV